MCEIFADMISVQNITKAVCSKMSGIPEKDISDNTSFENIFFPLTQELDRIFHVGAISDGSYEGATFADLVEHYEQYFLPEYK